MFRDAPDAGHVTPRGGIVDAAIAGQLVGLLAVLTAALAVALPGDATVPAAGTADLPQRQREIDEGEGVVDAARLLFRAPTGEDHRRGRRAEHVRGRDQIVLGHSRQLRDACRVVGVHHRADVFESFGACRDVALVDQAVADADVEEAVGERRVGAGAQLEVDRRPLGGRGRTRIGDDELPAVGPLRREVLHQRRHRLAGVAACEQNGACARDVLERERQPPVEPEGADRRRGAGRHAESAVVIDVRRLQCNASELAEEVGLFVGQRTAAEHADAVAAVTRLHGANTARDEIEHPIPRRRAQRAIGVADERRREAVRMRQRPGRMPAFDAQAALVDGETRVAGNLQRVGRAGEMHAALQSAVRTVRRSRSYGMTH